MVACERVVSPNTVQSGLEDGVGWRVLGLGPDPWYARLTCHFTTTGADAVLAAVEDLGRRGTDDLTAEVDVQGHRRVGVAKLVGNLTCREARLVEARRRSLAERVRGNPRPRSPVTTQRSAAVTENELTMIVETVSGAVTPLALEGVEQPPEVAGDVARVAQAARDRRCEHRPVVQAASPDHLECEPGYGDHAPARLGLGPQLHDESLAPCHRECLARPRIPAILDFLLPRLDSNQ